jgi:2-methylene-furan-3-one reductase
MSAVLAEKAAPEGDFSQVEYEDSYPTPSPKTNHGIIKVSASSVNPVDWKLISGHAVRYPKVLGFDIAGTLMDDNCSPRLNEGDIVWADVGNSDWSQGEYAQLGAYAGYAMAECGQIGLAPQSINLTEAAVIPLVGLTSYEALSMTGAPWTDRSPSNMSVVITSGAGGTGHVGLQMAKNWAKAGTVITAAGPDQLDFVKSMGADLAYDYTQSDIFDNLADDSVDIVYDNYGAAGTADKALRVLRTGGVFIYLPGKGGSLSNQTKEGVTQIDYGLTDSSNHSTLDVVRDMVDAGQLRGFVQQSFPLENVVEAFEMSMSGEVTGKLGIQVLAD